MTRTERDSLVNVVNVSKPVEQQRVNHWNPKKKKMFKMNNHLQNIVPFQPKTTPITDDYEISNNVLGLGINGKVVECIRKSNRLKFALKVSRFFLWTMNHL